jgi:hypothetical protein
VQNIVVNSPAIVCHGVLDLSVGCIIPGVGP